MRISVAADTPSLSRRSAAGNMPRFSSVITSLAMKRLYIKNCDSILIVFIYLTGMIKRLVKWLVKRFMKRSMPKVLGESSPHDHGLTFFPQYMAVAESIYLK